MCLPCLVVHLFITFGTLSAIIWQSNLAKSFYNSFPQKCQNDTCILSSDGFSQSLNDFIFHFSPNFVVSKLCLQFQVFFLWHYWIYCLGISLFFNIVKSKFLIFQFEQDLYSSVKFFIYGCLYHSWCKEEPFCVCVNYSLRYLHCIQISVLHTVSMASCSLIAQLQNSHSHRMLGFHCHSVQGIYYLPSGPVYPKRKPLQCSDGTLVRIW